MANPQAGREAGFDKYAANYDAALTQGISVSGESKDYFAAGRADWLERNLHELKFEPGVVLDFGCGTGTNSPFLLGLSGVTDLFGVDISEASLQAARAAVPDSRARFAVLNNELHPVGCDLAFTNGVFHHIPTAERAEAIQFMFRALRPGGILSFWENNPWNPGTRYIMSRIPFDRDAIMVSVRDAHELVRQGGFEILRSDFLFIFPNALRFLRKLESPLSKLPLGAQYQVLCRKPAVR